MTRFRDGRSSDSLREHTSACQQVHGKLSYFSSKSSTPRDELYHPAVDGYYRQ